MKKYFIGFVAAIILVFSYSFTYKPTYGCGSNAVDITVKSIHGHDYVIVSGTSNSNYGGTGVAIVHAESCSCKR